MPSWKIFRGSHLQSEQTVTIWSCHAKHIRQMCVLSRKKIKEKGLFATGLRVLSGGHVISGLVTNVPGICLVTSYADCVPLYFVDPIKKVIGLSHSGWRGTVGKIGKETVRVMKEHFGCDPADILAAVGPSICQDCYEVSGDVIEKFKEAFDEKDWDNLFYRKNNGKYQLDLWKANESVFRESGICKEHIAVTNVCTHCNSKILYSHRETGDKRGNLCAFLALK